MSTPLLTSPLHARHEALGAKLAEFGGWSMPLEYAGVVAEHTAVRNAVGLVDVSHLGKAVVRGPGAAAYCNSTLSNDLGRIAPGYEGSFVVLDRDIFTISPTGIHEAAVAQTWIQGDKVYDRE